MLNVVRCGFVTLQTLTVPISEIVYTINVLKSNMDTMLNENYNLFCFDLASL
jgi:hypothetical protein